MRLAAQGFTDNAIAVRLGISDGTVGTYWGRIRSKMGAHPRTELIAMSIRTELEQKLRDLSAQVSRAERSQSFSQTVFDSAEDGILVIDYDGKIVDSNPAAHRIFGYNGAGLIDRPLVDLIPYSYHETHGARLAEFRDNPLNCAIHPHLFGNGLKSDGQKIPVSIRVSAVRREGELLLIAFVRAEDLPPHEEASL